MALDTSETVALARYWWTFILRGVVAILFGILAFLAPLLGAIALVYLFAAWAIIDGVSSLIAGWQSRDRDRSWWLNLLEGVVGVAVGIIAILLPIIAVGALVLVIAAWAVVTGVLEIFGAVRLREQIRGEIWLGLAGLASTIFGLLLFLFPAAGVLTIVWLIGAFAVAFGVLMVVLGWRLRGIDQQAERTGARAV